MKHLIVGTAGHIDHGKSALVKALTGIDPDRLKEEKERGLTIDLGFAYFDLPDGTRVGFVDVPGHERFVKNMLAGAAGVDIVILVVDATESVMPQTREHLDIMRLLGISRGLVAITKIDLADAEMIQIVEAELEELAEGTFLEGAPVVKVSAKSGEGVETLRSHIAHAVSEQRQRDESGLFRFPIDRVFTMKGFGTVVTGTVFSGSLEEDNPVVVMPAGLSTRARQLQSHNVRQERIVAGMRAAMNLAGVAVNQVDRGDTLVKPGTTKTSSLFDAKVTLLPSAPRKAPRTSSVKLYLGTSQQVARMTLIDKSALLPGGEAYAQIRPRNPLCAFRKDRFVIRGGAPEITIGGGVILDVCPRKWKKKESDRSSLLEIIERAPVTEVALALLSREDTGTNVRDFAMRLAEPSDRLRIMLEREIRNGAVIAAGSSDDAPIIFRDCFEQLKQRVLAALAHFFRSQPHRLFMPREELRSRLGESMDVRLFERVLEELARNRQAQLVREGVTLEGRKPQISDAQKSEKETMEKIFLDAGFSPPTFSQAEERLPNPKSAKRMSTLLLEEGTLQKISPNLAYHKLHIEKAIEIIKKHFESSEKLGVGDLKQLLGVSRKHAVPLLEHFDRIGLTTRVGDYRVLRERKRQ